jgi:hypothetical protein
VSGPEARLEAACCRRAKALGMWPMKLWPLVTGLPDRLFLIPTRGGRVWFVEFKAPDGRVSKRQQVVHAQLREMGFAVDVVRSRDEFEWALRFQIVVL